MNSVEVVRRGAVSLVLALSLGSVVSGAAGADPAAAQSARCAALRKDNQRWVYTNDVVQGANDAFQSTTHRAIAASQDGDRYWTADERAHMVRVIGPVLDAFADLPPLLRSLMADVRLFQTPDEDPDLLDAAAELQRQYVSFDGYVGQQLAWLPVYRDWLQRGADPNHLPAGAPDPNGADPDGFRDALHEFFAQSGCYE